MEYQTGVIFNVSMVIVLVMVSCTAASQIQTGRNLTCYTCEEDYRRTVRGEANPCLSSLEGIDAVQCSRHDKYCKVEREELHGIVISMKRGCTDECLYGCKYQGFGLTFTLCTSCCRHEKCNTGNKANLPRAASLLKTIPTLIWLILWHR